MAPDTLSLWLSAGKPVTAVAIAQQVEGSRLAVDDPVARHVPEFAQHGKERITIMLDADVLEYFRSLAREPGAAPYQTQINSALRTAMSTGWRDDGRAELLDDEGFIAAVAEKVRTYTK